MQGPKILQRGAEDRRIMNKEVSREPHLAWCLANWLYCVSGQADHLQGHAAYLSFGLLTWHLGRSGSILIKPSNLLQKNHYGLLAKFSL